MAWDTEKTRRQLLEAGARQFAVGGFSAARMEAIGRDAGVNKERVYRYFGDKRGLYAAVLANQLDTVLDGVDIRGTGPEAVGTYAGELFDRFQENPIPARLLAWESLELDQPVLAEHRAALCAQRSTAIQAALPEIDENGAQQLLLSIVALTASWWTLAHLAGVILGGLTDDAQRRSTIVRQATDLARAASSAASVPAVRSSS